jgi:SpoIID/LytB domain protein
MRHKRIRFSLSIIILFPCLLFAQESAPHVRVGLLSGEREVLFYLQTPAVVMNSSGIEQTLGPGLWTAQVDPQIITTGFYRLAVAATASENFAEELVYSLAQKGLDAESVEIAIPAAGGFEFLHHKVYRILLKSSFATEEQAISYRDTIQDKTNCEPVKLGGAAIGSMTFTHVKSGKLHRFLNYARLISDELWLPDTRIGNGFHWEKSEARVYSGDFEFLVDQTGALDLIVGLSLEEYVKGVLPFEMPPGFPMEALKAQAIAARVEAMGKLGLRHIDASFDLCDEVHCQVYGGVGRRTESTDFAVESTQGIFMIHRNRLIEAYYSGNCGGHTESNENVWTATPLPFVRGRPDAKETLRGSLTNERDAVDWIRNRPDVSCNPFSRGTPASVNYMQKYFRWQVEVSRQDLEESILFATGKHVGELRSVRVLSRGTSGRVKELEVSGSLGRMTLTKDLPIRRALSKSTLYSSCIFFDLNHDQSGRLTGITIHGAGWGHGVGMCQAGAATMAHRGKFFDEILVHYYTDIFLKKVY